MRELRGQVRQEFASLEGNFLGSRAPSPRSSRASTVFRPENFQLLVQTESILLALGATDSTTARVSSKFLKRFREGSSKAREKLLSKFNLLR